MLDAPAALSVSDLEALCRAAVRGAGGDDRTADVLARATVAAERRGKPEVGAAHLLDYLDALRDGRLVGDATPTVARPRPGTVVVDAADGTTQAAFELALSTVVDAARTLGVAVLSIADGYSAGEIGWYARRLADEGLVALVGANSPALMSVYGAAAPVTGTNPLAFAVPHDDGARSFDQASSATAWVSVRAAADRGEPIPEGWAVDDAGSPTTDASGGLEGALLPAGGAKGANVAMMIELLAVLSGASLAIDAAPFDRGSTPPRLGLFALAIDPAAFGPGYVDRIERHLRRLADEHGADFGRRRADVDAVVLDAPVRAALERAAAVPAGDAR